MAQVVDAAKEAQRLMVEAALDLTRLKSKMRRACLMVLVDGVKVPDVARQVKVPRQTIHRALITARVRLAEVKAYMETLP